MGGGPSHTIYLYFFLLIFPADRDLGFHYIIRTVLVVRSAAPQTALLGWPEPRFKPGTGDL